MSTPSNQAVRRTGEEVTPLELFFDLVFAFAVSQLSHHLQMHVSWRGAAESLVMLLTILTVWSYTSWAATMIRVDVAGARWMMLAVMFSGLFMNASVTSAFTSSGWSFVSPLLAIQLGRTVWTIVVAPDVLHRQHYWRVLVWFGVTTPLWIAGAIYAAEDRLFWWAAATGIELLGTFFAHPVPGWKLESENVEFDADHMLERCRLFLLIALGETVLTSGNAVVETSIGWMTSLTAIFALTGTTALWALTFGTSLHLVARHVEETTNPILASRHAINALMAMVAGLVAAAVANEEVIAHPWDTTSIELALLLAGGPMLFLMAQGLYLRVVTTVRSKLHWIACVSLAAAGIIALTVPAYLALTLVSLTLAAIAVADIQRCRNG